MLKISQYPRNADGTPMDLEVGVLTDTTGNNGARLTEVPIGPDSAPIDAKALILVDATGAQVFPNATADTRDILAGIPSTVKIITLLEPDRVGTFQWSGSNLQTQVTNDQQRAIFIPPTGQNGSAGAWVRKYSNWPNIKWWGAKGDSNATATTGTDDTAAIQAAFNYITFLGGGTLIALDGYYKVTSYLTLPANVNIIGAGKKATFFVTAMAGGGGANLQENTRNGSIFYSNWPSNSSTNANITLKSLALYCANAANVGAGFYDNCGTFITIDDCWIKGTKFGAIFDQSELADITGGSIIEPANNNGACLWVVNNADLKVGNLSGVTNRISVSHTQLNAGNTVDLVRDDGGADHTYGPGNNYNGGLRHFRMAGVNNFLILGCEYEAATDHNMEFTYLSAAGAGAGSCSGAILGGMVSAANGKSCIHITSGGAIFVGGGIIVSGGGGTNPISGAANCGVLGIGDVINSTAVALTDGWGTITHRPLMLRAAAPVSGDYRQGDMFFNMAPTADSFAAARCIASGNPGTWEPLFWWTDGDKGDVLVNSDGTMVVQAATTGFAVSGGALTTTLGNPNFGLAAGYVATFDLGTTGTLKIQDPDGNTCDYHVRPEATKKGQISFTHNAVADRWSIGIKGSDANLYFAADRTLTSIKMTLSASALNLATGVALQNNGVALFNGSGVLQAAAFPALTGDATTAAGSLAVTISSATVVAKIAAQAIAPASVAATGNILTSGGLTGYTTGAGGAVTQLTSKTTTATLNKVCGQFTTNNAALASAALATFQITNSFIVATDTINLNLQSGQATTGTYRYWIEKVNAGSFLVTIENRSAGSLSESLVFNFAALHAVNA